MPGTYTPRFNLYKPAAGETGWSAPVNQNWDTIDSLLTNSLPRSFIAGFQLAPNTGAPTTRLDINPGQCQDVGQAGAMTLSSVLTKDMSAGWTVGSGNGGLASGVARTVSTWYHVFLIKRTDTNVIDAFFDTSVSAAHIPSPYTLYRRLGSIYLNATGLGEITPFTHYSNNDFFEWQTAPGTVNTTNPGTAAVTVVLFAPPGVNCAAVIHAAFASTTDTTVDVIAFTSFTQTDTAPNAAGLPPASLSANSNTGFVTGQFILTTRNDGAIRYRCNVSDANTIVRVTTVGYFDARGRNA